MTTLSPYCYHSLMFSNLLSTPSHLFEDEVAILQLKLDVRHADKRYVESYREEKNRDRSEGKPVTNWRTYCETMQLTAGETYLLLHHYDLLAWIF